MKRSIRTVLIILCVFLFSACSQNTQTAGTDWTNQAQQPLEGWQRVISKAKEPAQDDAVTELNHWKNGVRPGQDITSSEQTQGQGENSTESVKEGTSTSSPKNSSSVNNGSLSSKDMDYALTELVQLGYLDNKNASAQQMEKAIRQLQQDNKLPVTGMLDPATLKLLGL